MEKIQFIQVTPQELEDAILQGIEKQLTELKKEFTPKQPTKLLSRNKVAEMFNIDLSTVANWQKRNIITGYQIGGRILYKRSELENAIVKLK